MPIDDTRCRTCKLLPYRHWNGGELDAGTRNRGGVKEQVQEDKKWKTVTLCRGYSPTMRGKRLVTTAFWRKK